MNNFSKVCFISISLVQIAYASDIYYYQNNSQKYLAAVIDSINRNNSKINYYLTGKNKLLGVTDKLIIKLKSEIYIQQYLDEYDLIIVKKITKNTFLLQTKNKDLTLKIANQLHEKQDVEYAHPDFIKKRVER
jgi:hypothetical protein